MCHSDENTSAPVSLLSMDTEQSVNDQWLLASLRPKLLSQICTSQIADADVDVNMLDPTDGDSKSVILLIMFLAHL